MEPLNGEDKCPHCGYAADSSYLTSYLAPGVMLNSRYLVGRLLHHNGESAVYIGYDTENSVKVFIREYMPDTLCRRVKDSSVITVNQNSVAQYKTFMSEFVELNKTLARLRTLSHINPAIDMFGDNNTGYVVFNYVEGISLAEYLREHGGILSWEEVRKLFPPIFTTLSLIHNAGLIHRGICPENILVTSKGELMLSGFCVADERTAETELNSEIFHGYAAPEQYSSGRWQGTWTDVYGISALLYRLLTGTVPAEAPAREVNDTLPSPSVLNSAIPETVSDTLMDGLVLSGDQRIQTVTELVTRLFDEPQTERVPQVTQPIAIPKQHLQHDSGSDDDIGGFGRNNTSASQTAHKKKQAPSRHKIFIVVGAATVVVAVIIMAALMLLLNDNSSSIDTDLSATGTLANIDDLTGALERQTTVSVSESAESTQPTLNEVENSGADEDISETTTLTGNVYIMNDLVGKNYNTIKNSPTYASLVFEPVYEFNEDIEKGIIIDQSIEKGESYTEGTKVELTISQGSRYTSVPDFVGMKARDYYVLLNERGIKYEEQLQETTAYADGYVITISADEGDTFDLSSGETLIVYVAYNPAPATETEETTETSAEEETDISEEPDGGDESPDDGDNSEDGGDDAEFNGDEE